MLALGSNKNNKGDNYMILVDYTIRCECDKEDLEDVVKFFEEQDYSDDGFEYYETNFGFVGWGQCYGNILVGLKDDVRKLSRKHRLGIDIFSYQDDYEFCEYLRVCCGRVLEEKEGFCYDIENLFDDDERASEVFECLDFDEDMEIEDLYDCENSDGVRIFEFYYDYSNDDKENGFRLYRRDEDYDEDDYDDDDDFPWFNCPWSGRPIKSTKHKKDVFIDEDDYYMIEKDDATRYVKTRFKNEDIEFDFEIQDEKYFFVIRNLNDTFENYMFGTFACGLFFESCNYILEEDFSLLDSSYNNKTFKYEYCFCDVDIEKLDNVMFKFYELLDSFNCYD